MLYSSPYKVISSAMKKWPYMEVRPLLKGDNLVVFYYSSAYEIWPDNG